MNSIISLSHLRPLFTNSLLKRTINGKSASQKSFFSLDFARKPRTLSIGHPMKIQPSTCIYKRCYNESISARKTALQQHQGNHSHVWLMERLTSIGTLSTFIAMFLHPCENGELLFTFMLCSHVHWGMEAIMIDYLRPAVVGATIPKYIPVLTFALSGSLLVLLAWTACYGNGIAGSIQQLWYLDPFIEPYDEDESKLNKPAI